MHRIAHQIQLVHRVKIQVEGGEHEFVDPEPIVAQAHGFQLEPAVPEARRKGKLAARSAPFVGGKLQGLQNIILGIVQAHFYLFPFAHLKPERRVSLEHHRLEAEDIAGPIGALVLIDMAAHLVVVLLLRRLAANLHFAGLLLPANSLQRIILIGAHGFEKRLGQRRKAVQFEAARSHLLAVLEETEGHLPQGLSALVMCHIDATSAAVGQGGYRQGVLRVALRIELLPLLCLQRVIAVGKLRQGYRDAVRQIKTALGVVQFPLLERILALFKCKGGLGEILEADKGLPFLGLNLQAAAGEGFHQVGGIGAAFHQAGVLTFVGLSPGFQVFGVLVKCLVGAVIGLVGHQFSQAQGQQLRLGIHFHRLAGVLLRQRFHGTVFLFPFAGRPVVLHLQVVIQGKRIGIPVPDLLLQGRLHFHAHGAAGQQVPEDVLPVAGYELHQRAAQVGIGLAIEGRVVPYLQALAVLLRIVPHSLGRGVVPVVHPQEGDQRLIEGFHLLGQLAAQAVPLLPVPAAYRIHIGNGSVVEIYRQLPLNGFFLDLLQDLGLLLGPVGLAGLLVLLPEGGELMSVVHSLSK